MAARSDLAQEILAEEARVNDLERQCEDSRRRLSELRSAQDGRSDATVDGALTSDGWPRERKRAPFSRETLAAFHGAEAEKGRRLTAVDLRNQNRVAALMAWHFEPRPAQGGSRRPLLVVALALAGDTQGTLRGEYLTACWLLCLIGLAIDRRTVAKGRIGVVLDAAIALSREELAALGFKRGRRRGGYSGDYFELVA
jgi:hypothetical protein